MNLAIGQRWTAEYQFIHSKIHFLFLTFFDLSLCANINGFWMVNVATIHHWDNLNG